MKALVTGGLGLIGSHIVMRLLKDGHEVRILDKRDLSEWPLGTMPLSVEFHKGDIAEILDCHRAMNGIDVVFHTAAIARTAETLTDPMGANRTNVDGTLNLLQMAKVWKVKRFVHSSSSIVYTGPSTPYAVGKIASEHYVTLFGKLYNLSTISLRYANVYGPGQRRDGAYPNVLASFARDKAEKGYITIYGDGSVTRDFVHVDDVVEANMLAMKSEEQGTFDICFGEYWDIKRLSELFDCEVRHAEERPGDTKLIQVFPGDAMEKLGFRAQIQLNKQSISSYL